MQLSSLRNVNNVKWKNLVNDFKYQKHSLLNV